MLLLSLLLTFLSASPLTEDPVAIAPPTLFISYDQGGCWNDFTNGLPEDVRPRSIVENNETLYLSTFKYGVFILPKDADAWQLSSNGLPTDSEIEFFPTSLAANDEVLVMGTYWDGIYVSKNGGENWQKSKSIVPGVIGALFFNDNMLLAGTSSGVWESKDQGDSWQRRSEDRTSVNALIEHNGQIFVAKQNGMGVLQNKDIVWSNMKSDYALLLLVSNGEYVYALNVRNDIFRSKDGSAWEAPTADAAGADFENTLEAAWSGFEPKLPGEESTGIITETSRGWILPMGGGC